MGQNKGIYKLTFPNGKVYIGQTNNMLKRMSKYSNLDCVSQPALYNAICKYGWRNVIKEIIDDFIPCDNLTEYTVGLNNLEIYWVAHYKSTDKNFGYNITSGGGGHLGRTMSAITRKKMSAAKIGRAKTEICKHRMRETLAAKRLPGELTQLETRALKPKEGTKECREKRGAAIKEGHATRKRLSKFAQQLLRDYEARGLI